MTRRVAVVGAGPSGLFAAQALLNTAPFEVEIDIFDWLPTPFGLLRYGVARSREHQGDRGSARAGLRLRPGAIPRAGRPGTRRDRGLVQGRLRRRGLRSRGQRDQPDGDPRDPAGQPLRPGEFVARYSGHPDRHSQQAAASEPR
ncbi:MAG: FAD/NAD(P)-binding protein [Propionibacteriaceae bacterium]|nr:FAD/NAD(P)-binding protein [Propionibacteriaceae bacterium]